MAKFLTGTDRGRGNLRVDDATTDVYGVNHIVFSGATLTDDGDGKITVTIAGGGGTPGGADTQIQYNDGGSFGGNAAMTFADTGGAEAVAFAATSSATLLAVTQSGAGSNTIITSDDATVAGITNPLRVAHTTSGTPAVGIGTGIEFETETAVGNNEIGSIIESVSTNVTSPNEQFDLVFKNMNGAAAAEVMRITSTGAFTTTASVAAGTTVSGTTVSDGAGGTMTGGTVTGTTVTDGTVTITGGAIASATTVTASGLITGGAITNSGALVSSSEATVATPTPITFAAHGTNRVIIGTGAITVEDGIAWTAGQSITIVAGTGGAVLMGTFGVGGVFTSIMLPDESASVTLYRSPSLGLWIPIADSGAAAYAA